MNQKPDLRTEVPESPIKTKSFFDSIRYAFKGVGYAFKTERNFKLYIVIVIVFFITNLIVGVSLPGHIAFFICASGAFAAEMINTAIEHIMDLYTPELHPEVKIIKDLGAAGVWMWGGAFFIMEGIYICHALFA